ncbi:hypothetical protein XANCAGTX0491_003854 [Xanthoria calcicola]
MTSPPASPRFPSNHGGNFENPGSPPPISQTIPRSVPTSTPPMQFANSNPPGLVPVRPAPSAPSIAKAVNLIPTRAAPPQLPPSSHRWVDYGRPSMDAVSRGRSQSNAADEVSQDLKPSTPGFKRWRGDEAEDAWLSCNQFHLWCISSQEPNERSDETAVEEFLGSDGSHVQYQQQRQLAMVTPQ